MPMKHEHILNPITAVEFCQNGTDELLVLVGEGSFLKVFEASSCKLLRQCEIFNGQTIHGIAVQTTSSGRENLKVVIWGGPYLATFNNHQFEQLLTNGSGSLANVATSAPDWIMNVALSPESPNKFALVTAHNTVLQARLQSESGTIVLERPSSPSRSILYSAHLIWESPSTLLVAAGTVFGEIIAWKCDVSGTSKVLHTFTGHEGSIFGVNLSEPVTFPDMTVGRLLASCSDDRTIRVWKLASESLTKASEHEKLILRETGFGDNQVGDRSTGYESLATVMGHASRIWGVKIIVQNPAGSTYNHVSVLSFGEDSTTQHWDLEYGQEFTKDSGSQALPTAKLVQLNTFAFHSGKHIWSAALSLTSEAKFSLVTGGADGKISMYPIGTCSTADNRDEESRADADLLTTRPNSWELEEILRSCSSTSFIATPPIIEAELLAITQLPIIDPKTGKPAKKAKAKKIPKDALNRYGFVSEAQVLMTTTFGRVFLGNIGDHVEWQEIFLPADSPTGLKSYALVTGFPSLGLAFLAGANGKVYIYQNGHHLHEVADVGFKVADMFNIFNHTTNTSELFVTTLGGQSGTLFTLDISSPGRTALEKTAEYQLPDKFVVTSVGRINDILALGSRTGSIALYAQDNLTSPLHLWTPPPTSAPESITTIIAIPSSSATIPHMLTTDRAGKYTIFSYNTLQSLSTSFLPVHHGHPPFGPMIEAAFFSGPSQDLILYGFKGKNFVVWNESQHFEITNVDCGGAHRSYAYSPLSKTGGGHFVYTKASKLYIHTQTSPSHTIVKTGGHGREIKVCAVSPDSGYIATAAEDTEIRLWCYEATLGSNSRKDNTLSSKAIAQRHTAGIQHLSFHKDYLFSSGGNEEFYIWALTPIPGLGLGILCEAAYPDQSPDCDLRIMSFDVCAFPGREDTVLISLAFSDSTMRCYAYSQDAGFQLVAKGRYTSSCIMQIKYIKVSSEEVFLLTAATDGRLVLWKLLLSSASDQPAQLTAISSRKVHQSSIKTLDLFQIPTSNSGPKSSSKLTDKIMIATGGDDNALGISIYNLAQLSSPPQSFLLRSAHAAAVTGISFIPSLAPTPAGTKEVQKEGGSSKSTRKEEVYKVVSSSNDQRVKEWAVIISPAEESAISNLGSETEEMAKEKKQEEDVEAKEGEDRVEKSIQTQSAQLQIKIKLLSDVFTAVADVSDLAVLATTPPSKEERSNSHSDSDSYSDSDSNNARILVVGNGMEVYAVSE